MNWNGLIVGIGTFLLIGVFHVEKANRRALKLYGRLGYSVMNDEGTRLRLGRKIRFKKQ